MATTMAASMKTRYLKAAPLMPGFSLSNSIRMKLGMVISCQKAQKNHMVSVMDRMPYMPPTKSSRNGWYIAALLVGNFSTCTMEYRAAQTPISTARSKKMELKPSTYRRSV